MGASGHRNYRERSNGIHPCTALPDVFFTDTHRMRSHHVSPDFPPDGKAILRTHSYPARKESAMANLPATWLGHPSLHDGAGHRHQAHPRHPYPVHCLLLFGLGADAGAVRHPFPATNVGLRPAPPPTPSRQFPTPRQWHPVPSSTAGDARTTTCPKPLRE